MKRRILIVLLVVAVLVGGGLAYLEWSGNAPDEVVELVATGGEKTLRDPLRPPRAGSRVILIALDGVGATELQRALTDGRMPRTAALLGRETSPRVYEHAWSAPGVLSVLPSTTYAAWASVFTGEPPARTGVPGNEWFAREEMRFYAPAPVSVTQHEHALQVYTDQLMGRVLRAPTVYERANVRAHVSLQAYHRGADLLTVPDAESYGTLITDMAGGLVGDESVGQEAYEALDEAAAESLVESIRKHGVPALQTIYFPGVDLYTHVAADPLNDQQRYLGQVVDPAIHRVLQAYRQAGVLDSTWIVVVADHGHTPVLTDDRHSLGAEGDDEPPQVLRNAGFRTRPLELELDSAREDYQAAVAYQGAFAYVYLADRSTCARPGTRCDWNRAPRLEQDVLPVARAFWAASRTGAGVPALRGTLDLVLARPPRPPGQDALPFQVFDGQRLISIRAYLAANPRPELLELERRLEGLGAGPYGHRAGDVLLLARTGAHLPVEQRFYFSSSYHSWHGSPTLQDSEIPLLVVHPGATGEAVRARVMRAAGRAPDQLSITPIVLDLLRAGP